MRVKTELPKKKPWYRNSYNFVNGSFYTNVPRETPSWLNEACNHAITAAQKTLHHLCEASRVNA
jgi:hypothetical protein